MHTRYQDEKSRNKNQKEKKKNFLLDVFFVHRSLYFSRSKKLISPFKNKSAEIYCCQMMLIKQHISFQTDNITRLMVRNQCCRCSDLVT